jgi:hypothetical protein
MIRVGRVLCAAAIVLGSSAASFAADFNSAVKTVLLKQQEVMELDSARQGQMIACVQKVLADVPAPKQRYVAEGANYDEMESRFGEVVLADRAKYKQKITSVCGGIVVSQ